MGWGGNRSRRAISPVWVWSVLLVVLVAVFGSLLVTSQAGADDDAAETFDSRVEVAGAFVRAYGDDLVSREAAQGTALLADPTVDPRTFELLVAGFGFQGAVLLDGDGRALATYPNDPARLGQDLATGSDHLAAALAGTPAVSGLVTSMVEGIPVVAFATPFDTANGRRVFSGEVAVDATPLPDYVANAVPVDDRELYIIDAAGHVLALSRSDERDGAGRTIDELEPELAAALVAGAHRFVENGDRHYLTSVDVQGFGWRIVAAAPEGAVLQPLGSLGVALWLAFAAVVASSIGVLVMLVHSRRLGNRHANAASTDLLTGLRNRRYLYEWFEHGRGGTNERVACLMVDLDHFKAINDTHGHTVGDTVLQIAAERIRQSVRDRDIVARWGGEEILAVLPGADLAVAARVAERVRASLDRDLTAVVLPPGIHPTCSVGFAAGDFDGVGEVITAADRGVLAAKSAGRNCCRPDPAASGAGATTGALTPA